MDKDYQRMWGEPNPSRGLLDKELLDNSDYSNSHWKYVEKSSGLRIFDTLDFFAVR